MIANSILARFVDVLLQEHGCHTVILYGSRARGDAGPESDYDLLGVRDGGDSVRDARVMDSAFLDAFIHPAAKVECAGAEMLHVRGGVVLCERNAIGTTLLARLDEVYAAGPRPLPADEAETKRVWARKMILRIRRGDLEGHYRRAWLLTALLEDYFLLRGAWYLGPKASLAWLESHDRDGHGAFARALTPGADVEAIEDLVGVVTRASCEGRARLDPQRRQRGERAERTGPRAARVTASVRSASPEDAAAVVRIGRELVEDGTTYAFAPDTSDADLHAYWFRRGGATFVAVEDNVVVGCYVLLPNQKGRGAHIANASYAVARHGAGRGVGRLMGEHSIREAASLGYAAMQFNYVVSTNHAAVALWTKLGFSIIGRSPRSFNHPQLGLVDTLIMHRAIDGVVGG